MLLTNHLCFTTEVVILLKMCCHPSPSPPHPIQCWKSGETESAIFQYCLGLGCEVRQVKLYTHLVCAQKRQKCSFVPRLLSMIIEEYRSVIFFLETSLHSVEIRSWDIHVLTTPSWIKIDLLDLFHFNFFLVHCATKTVYQDHGRGVRFAVKETPGREEYHSRVMPHYRQADAVIIVYDITWQDSLRNTRKWFDIFRDCARQNVFTALAGNKADHVHRRLVTYEVICVCSHINGLRQAYNLQFFLSNLILSHSRETIFFMQSHIDFYILVHCITWTSNWFFSNEFAS